MLAVRRCPAGAPLVRRGPLAAALLLAFLARAESASLAVQVLGSGGPRPSPQASSGTLVMVDGVPRILVDAGPGTLLRAGERKVDLTAVDAVLLTHLHTDHTVEVPSFATVRSLDSHGRTRLRIVGPDGNKDFPSTRAWASALLGPQGAYRYVRHFGAELAIEATDVPAGRGAAPKRIALDDGLVVTARGHHHGNAPAVGFRLEHGGRSLVLVGDVDPSGLAAVETLARDADLLVISCSALDPPDSPAALYEFHSPPSAIGPMAVRARVRALLCTHLPPAVTARADALRRSLAASFSGPITLATDGLVLPVQAAGSAAGQDAGPATGCRTDADCGSGVSCMLCGETGTCIRTCETEGCPSGSVCRPVQCVRCPCPPQCVPSH